VITLPIVPPVTQMKIAKTVIFLQQNDEDDANEMDLIAEGKKHNKTPVLTEGADDSESSSDGSEIQSTINLDTLTSKISSKIG